MARRQCPRCGAFLRESVTRCPECREELGQVQTFRGYRTHGGGAEIRRGLLYILMAAVIHYFVGSSSPLPNPVPFAPLLTNYVLPFLFLCGIGLVVLGLYRRVRG